MFVSIVHSLQEVVATYPDNIAIVDGKNRCSYDELWSEVAACACVLKQLGLSKGDRVALYMNNSASFVSSYYGIIACGAVVVALNTTAKGTDIKNWLQHSGAQFLIAEKKLYRPIESGVDGMTQIQRIVIDDGGKNRPWEKRLLGVSVTSFQPELLSAEMPVAIIYTSGTTGQPKGVTLSHGNYVANLSEVITYLSLSSSDSILNILPFYYSYGNSILHTHLLTGATIVLENDFMYPVKSLKKIADMKITGFSGVPATFLILLNKTTLTDYDLSSLRYVTQAGGPMPPSSIRKFIGLLDHVSFFVMYGQTEATARLTYLEPTKLLERMGSVGKPLNGVQIEIRDESSDVVDPGIEGELYVSGPNIMSGYWKNKTLTEQVIVNGFLKTGDLGYKDDDGYIFLTGRRADMIKVGGNRISPLEVEELVHQLAGVEQVAATGVADELLGQVIKLTIVRNKGSNLNERAIKAYCREHLALYKVPKFISFVDDLPKTASGKVKRFLL